MSALQMLARLLALHCTAAAAPRAQSCPAIAAALLAAPAPFPGNAAVCASAASARVFAPGASPPPGSAHNAAAAGGSAQVLGPAPLRAITQALSRLVALQVLGERTLVPHCATLRLLRHA